MRIPGSTYRLQLHRDFGLRQAADLVPYLAALGITDLYLSPIGKARKGSLHGYDAVDPNALNPELGSPADLEAFILALKGQGLGWLQDIVPNHMAFDSENRLLMEVMEQGPGSRYAEYFDIEWNHVETNLKGKLLAPFLGKPFSQCLEAGEIRLEFGEEGFGIRYYALRLPVALSSFHALLALNLPVLKKRLDRQHPDYSKFMGVLFFLKNLSMGADIPAEEREEEIRFVKALLWELYSSNSLVRLHLEENVRCYNGEPGKPESFNRLYRLLEEQHYRLAYWKVGREEINYRRFFAVNELICVRVESERVFRETHRLALKLLQDGHVTGLRVDHIDGLYDPAQYLARLREAAPEAYIVVEKILGHREELRNAWPIQGTTGYDFMNLVNQALLFPGDKERFDRLYRSFSGELRSLEKMAEDKKRLIIERDLYGGLENLAHQLKHIAGKFRYGSDFTMYGFRNALEEMLVHFPVYRAYVGEGRLDAEDEALIRQVADKARRKLPVHRNEIDFIEQMLLAPMNAQLPKEERDLSLEFARRLQQFTSPLMAKGFEDTVLFVYNRFLALNEVGGDPGAFGLSAADFHSFCERRQRLFPSTQNALMTHDAKRGGDFRARLAVLSEVYDDWEALVLRWRKDNAPFKTRRTDLEMPDPNDEYFLYQSLVGALPAEAAPDLLRGEAEAGPALRAFRDRVQDYFNKCIREAKVHTGWIEPDAEYEEAFRAMVDSLLLGPAGRGFRESLHPFLLKVSRYGYHNSLSQALLHLTAPGLPDTYQGSETWDFRLVDPDNRSPVDYAALTARLERLKPLAERVQGAGGEGTRAEGEGAEIEADLRHLLDHLENGDAKLYLLQRVLHHRRARPRLFAEGAYLPLPASGKARDHVLAFARIWTGEGEKEGLLVLAPRFFARLEAAGGWGDTALPLPAGFEGRWRCLLTGRTFPLSGPAPVGDLLRSFPVAVLAWRPL